MRVWIDGHIVDGSEARIPVTDHGLLYGDGIFEGMRIYGRRVFRLEDHMARFAVAAKALALELPGGIRATRQIVLDTASDFAADEAYIRLIATRGDGPLGIDPTTCPEPRLLCIIDRIAVYSEEKQRVGVDLVTSSLRRPSPDVLDPRVKSLNYLNNALAKLEAKQHGADDALLLNAAGMIAEAAVANVFVVRDGDVLTPPSTDGALEGITRATLMGLATAHGFRVLEKSLGRFDLFAADEAFLTGSGAGVVPIRSLDARTIGDGSPGPVYQKLRAAFIEAAPSMGVAFE